MVDGLTLTLDLSKLPREFETTPSEAVTALVEFAVDVGASDLFFLSEEDAVAIAQHLVSDIHLHPVYIGSLATGGRLMELGGALSGLELFIDGGR